MTPNPSRSQIFSPKPPHCDLVLVEDLIDESKNRNIPLLSHLFSDVEVQSILSLSLSFRLPNDKLIWHYDRKGIFSVKSAYQVTRDWIQSRREAASSSSANSSGEAWKKLWAARVPPKVKTGVCRIGLDIIPTCINLHRKRIQNGYGMCSLWSVWRIHEPSNVGLHFQNV